MVLTASCILFCLLFLLPPLRRNTFYILHCCTFVLLAYWVEKNYFSFRPFSYKTLLLFLVVQFILINIFAFFAYWKDKRAAQKGEWRIPEKDLHWLEFLGGWSGALIAQKVFRHKTKKKSFQTIFWLVPSLQITLILFILYYLGLLHI